MKKVKARASGGGWVRSLHAPRCFPVTPDISGFCPGLPERLEEVLLLFGSWSGLSLALGALLRPSPPQPHYLPPPSLCSLQPLRLGSVPSDAAPVLGMPFTLPS